MSDPVTYTLADLAITTPQVGAAQTPITGLADVTAVTLEVQFNYGSGGTSTRAYVQVSIDGGSTWMDVACFAFKKSSASSVVNLSGDTAMTASARPGDGTLADNTYVNGVLGSQMRVKLTTEGTYVNTTLGITASARSYSGGLDANVTATGSTTARSLADRFADRINVLDYGAVGNGTVDDAPAIRAAIAAAVNTGKPLWVPRPAVRYRCASIQVTESVGAIIFRLPPNFIMMGDGGELRNEYAVDANFIVGEAGAENITVQGIYVHHNAQSVEDIAGGEPDLGFFTDPPGFFPQINGTPRYAIWMRGKNCKVSDCKVKRSQTGAIRYSSTASGSITNNLVIESRAIGINITTESTLCRVINNTVLETEWIGVIAFMPNATGGGNEFHIISENTIVNTNGRGEGGIDYGGVTGVSRIKGGIITNNFCSGFGMCGIRVDFADDGVVANNRLTNIGNTVAQQTAFPGSTQRTGIIVQDAHRWSIESNTVDYCNNFGLFTDTDDGHIGPSNVFSNTGAAPVRITGRPDLDGFGAWDSSSVSTLVRGAKTYTDTQSFPGGINRLFFHPGYKVNNWYQPSPGILPSVGSALGVNTARFFPILIFEKCTISELMFRTTTAGTNAQLALYAKHATNHLPTGTPLGSTGNIDVSGAVGIKTGALTVAVAITVPGLYWAGINSDNAALACTNGITSYVSALIGAPTTTNLFGAASFSLGFYVAKTFGTWDDLTGTNFTETAGGVALIGFKVSSVP